MPDSPHPRLPGLPRRGFLALGAATAAVAALPTAAFASPATIDRAAGPVADRVLALSAGRWVLADTAGATTPTTGLDGADVVGVARGADGFTAVGSRDGKAVIWASADGVAWTAAQRRNDPHAAFTAVGAGAGRVLVLGSLLSEEGTPVRAVAALRTAGGAWQTLPVRGLGDDLAITAVTGDSSGWTAAAVGIEETTVYHSPDAITWTEGTRVTATAVRELTGTAWTGNALDDAAPVRGVLGGGREVVTSVPRDAQAIGGGFWLSGGTIVRGTR
ncbi:hypothetical protein GCM10023148_31850 [Actinokineospora soli]